MKKIIYTPNATDKLRAINRDILLKYGSEKAKEIVGKITKRIRMLAYHENMGQSVQGMYGVSTDYRYIFVQKNYVFYSIENDFIRIINIYNEKEDIMWLVFGIDTEPQGTRDYWGN